MQKLFQQFENVYKYLVAALLIAIPLYPKFPVFSIPGTYVAIRLEDFLIGLILMLFVFFKHKDLMSEIRKKMFLPFFLFLGVGFISLLSAYFLTSSIDLRLGILHLARRVEYMSMFVVGYFALKERPENINFYVKLFPVVIALSFIFGFGQKYFNWPIIITQNEEYAKGVALRYVEGGHINSTFAGHYDLATYLVLVLPLVLSLVVYFKKIHYFYAAVYFSGLWLLVNTASRISFLSFIFASIVSLYLIKRLKKGLVFIIISIFFIAFSSNLIGRYQRIIEIFELNVRDYLSVTVSSVSAQEFPIERRELEPPTPTQAPVFEDRSTSIRLNVEWPRALRAFSKNPLLGTGYSSITLATDNDYLRLLGEVGLLGFISFALIFIDIVYYFLNYMREKKMKLDLEKVFVYSIAAGFLGTLINAFFIDVFEASKFAITLWLILGMGFRIISNDINKNN